MSKQHKKLGKPDTISPSKSFIKQQAAAEKNNKKVKLFFSLLIGALALAIYANSINNSYTLDDFSVIKENNIVKNGAKSIPLIFNSSYRYGYLNVNDGLYRPFTLMMYAIEWQLFPDKPAIYHLVNILLYALTGVVMFRLLCKALKQYNIILPLIATLLFIVHPIHTEVVANIKSRDEIMCFLCVLLSINYLFNYVNEKKTPQILLSILFYIIALFSKESGILMLAFAPLFLMFFSEIKFVKVLSLTAIFIIPTLIYLSIRNHVLHSTVGIQEVALVDNLLIAAKSVSQKYATAFVILAYYIKLLIVPHPLLYNYSYNQIPIVGFSNPFAIASVLFHVAMLVYGLSKIKIKRENLELTENPNQDARNVLGFSVLFYLVGVSLFSNMIITIGAAMGERFIYFSSFGFCLAIAFLILKLLKVDLYKTISKPSEVFSSKPLLALVSVIVLLFSAKTIARNPNWKDNLTLYRHDLPISENSVRSHYYLGNELIKQQNELSGQPLDTAAILEGCKHLEEALKIYPDYNDANTQLGVAYYKIKDFKKSEKCYLITLNNNPNDAVAINNLAAIYFNTAQYQKAIEMYEKAIVLNPRFSDAMVNIGSCYGSMQQFEESIKCFKQAISISPDNAKAYFFMSKSYSFIGNKAEADIAMAEAQSIDPSLK
jgi:hypothetical protein